MKHRSILFAGILMAVLIPVGTASAHRPLWGDELGVTQIPDLHTSFAVYRDLTAESAVQVYTVEGQAGDILHGGINIPVVQGLERYGVSVAIFGEGLPQLEESQKPPQHPEDLGGIIIPTSVSEDFFEPFTQTNYWGRQNFDIELPQTGVYYIIVWHPEGIPGKYVMDTGTAEVFGPADILNFPIWWVQVHIFFGHGPYLIAGLLVVLALIVAPGLIRRWQTASLDLSFGGA